MTKTHALTRFWWAFLAIGAVAVLLAVGLPAALTKGADHLDAPGLTSPGGDGRLDINDVYAFQSPSTPANAVLIMTVNPLTPAGSAGTFHPSAFYDFKIDTDGNAKEDITYQVTFSEPDGAGVQDVTLRRLPALGENPVLATGKTGEDIPVDGGGTLRADVYDDPFFFDLLAFLGAGGRAFCDAGTMDFFAGPPAFNVSAIVLEVPSSSLGPSNIGVWARTKLNGQVDRMGRPAINTVFIPTGSKNAFNKGKPKKRRSRFQRVLGAL